MRNLLLLACLLSGSSELGAQASTIILVRHAEKAGPSGDVDLSAAGRDRATALATTLAHFPVQGIFVSQFKRTRQTASPVADSFHVPVTVVPIQGNDISAQAAATAQGVRALPPGSAALVVGHSNTLGKLIAALGGPVVNDLCDPQYATLFILEIPATGPVRLIRASYGAPDPADADACSNPRPAMEQRQP